MMNICLGLSNKKRNSVGGLNARGIFAISIALALSGCASSPDWLSSSGPSVAQVVEQEKVDSPISVVELNDAVARGALAAQRADSFAEALSGKAPPAYVVGAGDVLEVSIWEAPPAVLFGAAVVDPRAGLTTTRQTTLPEQIVNSDGIINVPFSGAVQVAGRRPSRSRRRSPVVFPARLTSRRCWYG